MTQHLHPSSWPEAAGLLEATPGTVVVAGGTALQPWLTFAVSPPPALVHLDRIPGAGLAHRQGDVLTVGALVPVAAADLLPWWGDDGPWWFATPAVRRRATLVGNLVSGLGPRELGPLAVATDAVVETWDGAGPHQVPVADLLASGAATTVVAAAVVVRLPERISYHRVTPRTRMSRVEVGVCAARGPGCGAALVVGAGEPAVPVPDLGDALDRPDGAEGLVDAVLAAGRRPIVGHVAALLAGLARRVHHDLHREPR